MKNCLRIPRLLVPGEDKEKWAAPPVSRGDAAFWQRAAEPADGALSARSLILPDALFEGDGKERIETLLENDYTALEEEKIYKLARGTVAVERETPFGVRCGALFLIDLEEFAADGKTAAVRLAAELDPDLVRRRMAVRAGTILEFPHTVLCYRDKRGKVMRTLREGRKELLYDLVFRGERVRGFEIPDYAAEEAARLLMGCADPCFGVLEGGHTLAGAKAHWEALKGGLSARETRYHPARFALAEFVELSDDAVALCPVHRLVRGTDADALCCFLTQNVKCKREGNTVVLASESADGLLSRYLSEKGGTVVYTAADLSPREDEVLVRMPPVGKDDFLSALKTGKKLPCRSFCLGEEEGRFSLEGRETSYD